MKTNFLKHAAILALLAGCLITFGCGKQNATCTCGEQYSAKNGNEDKIILKVLKDEPVYVRKECFEYVGRVDTFFFELINHHSEFPQVSILPVDEIPEQFREEGLSVYISGNVTNCIVAGGCIEPYFRLASIYLFELESIKINTQ
jgi:hypothetical protein